MSRGGAFPALSSPGGNALYPEAPLQSCHIKVFTSLNASHPKSDEPRRTNDTRQIRQGRYLHAAPLQELPSKLRSREPSGQPKP